MLNVTPMILVDVCGHKEIKICKSACFFSAVVRACVLLRVHAGCSGGW